MYHTFDICQQIAEKLKDPETVSSIISNAIGSGRFYSDRWDESTLATGWPGIALFFSAMDRQFPNSGYDKTAYNYLQLSLSSPPINLSLLQGLSGIAFVVYHCSLNGARYSNLLETLDEALIDQWNCFSINEISQNFRNGLLGFSSFLIYLTLRKESPKFQIIIKECLTKLINSLNDPVLAFNRTLPGWYTSVDFLNEDAQKKYPNGKFDLSMMYGICGTLSILSLCANQGIWIYGLRETIFNLSNWLKLKQKQLSVGPVWDHSSSYEEEIGLSQDSPPLYRDAWCYGTPCVARTLYSAGKALNDKQLLLFSEDILIQSINKPDKEWNLMGPTFAFGRAGLLAIVLRMNQATNNWTLSKKAQYLEQDIKRFYSPAHPFGFQSVDSEPPNLYRWVDDPGLVNGATGIALSLLSAQGQDDSMWDRIFLVS